MAEAVIDTFETVEVNKQNGKLIALLAPAYRHHLLNPVEKQGSVWQAGEGVVKGVVNQALLDGFSVRNVRQRARHAGRCAILSPDGEAAAENPAIIVVFAFYAVFVFKIG